MDKDTVIDYVMNTPHNPNKAVLSGMLDSLASGSGGEGTFVVTFSWGDSETITADKTVAECLSAFDAGKALIATDLDGNIYQLQTLNREDETVDFSAVYVSSSEVHSMIFSLEANEGEEDSAYMFENYFRGN